MSVRLTDFGLHSKPKNTAYFVFTLEEFSSIETHKISKVFRYGGHFWKLQATKKGDYFGMFLRWFGSQYNETVSLRSWCNARLAFHVVNKYDPTFTISEERLKEENSFEVIGGGIGYSKMIRIQTLQLISGFIINDTLHLQVDIRLESTTFQDKVACSVEPDRMFIRSQPFAYFGTEWSLLLFPDGEVQPDDEDTTPGVANLYLSRDEESSKQLRHRVKAFVFVRRGSHAEISQKFYDDCTNNYGSQIMLSKDLYSLGEEGFIDVGVTFFSVQPYILFSTQVSSSPVSFGKPKAFQDYSGIPWTFGLNITEGGAVVGELVLDPEGADDRTKMLHKLKKKFEVQWKIELLCPEDISKNVICQADWDRGSIFKRCNDKQTLELPISLKKLVQDDSVYHDEDGFLCLHVSMIASNITYAADTIPVDTDYIVRLKSAYNAKLERINEEHEQREAEFKSKFDNAIEEQKAMVGNRQELVNALKNKMREKDVMIHSLQEQLEFCQDYITNLEEDADEAISRYQEYSIEKLIKFSRPDQADMRYIEQISLSLTQIIQADNEIPITRVAVAGAFGQGVTVKGKLQLDLVVFLSDPPDDDEEKWISGIVDRIESLVKHRLRSGKDIVKKSEKMLKCTNFLKTSTALLFKCNGISVTVLPSSDWQLTGGHRALYKTCMNQSHDMLHRFVVAASDRQVQFVSKQPNKCKDLIRIVKKWSEKVDWLSVMNRPNGYLLALLTIQAYQQIESDCVSRTPSFNKEVLTELAILVKDEQLEIQWEDYYYSEDYPVSKLPHFQTLPLVRDPALPAHNVAATGIGDWSQFRDEMTLWVKRLTF